jgi:hypothetical protein
MIFKDRGLKPVAFKLSLSTEFNLHRPTLSGPAVTLAPRTPPLLMALSRNAAKLLLPTNAPRLLLLKLRPPRNDRSAFAKPIGSMPTAWRKALTALMSVTFCFTRFHSATRSRFTAL